MRKKLVIDIRDHAFTINKMVDREKISLTETIRKHRKAIMEDIQACIDQIPLYDRHITSKVSYKLDVKNREIVVTFEWDGQSNINTWLQKIDRNLIVISNYLSFNSKLRSYTQ